MKTGQLTLIVSATLLLAVSACSSPRTLRTMSATPDSTGLVLLDCQFKFDVQGDDRRFDQYLTTGLERLRQAQPAQSAFFSSIDDRVHLMAAKPNRGFLLLGPLRPGTYVLDQVAMDREFIEVVKREGMEFVRDPAVCKPGMAGTNRIAFVVEAGAVTFIGRMTATCDLKPPEEQAARLSDAPYRLTFTADNRTWAIAWDREIHYEIVGWERILVGLKKTAWKEPIERRLEFLRSQQPEPGP